MMCVDAELDALMKLWGSDKLACDKERLLEDLDAQYRAVSGQLATSGQFDSEAGLSAAVSALRDEHAAQVVKVETAFGDVSESSAARLGAKDEAVASLWGCATPAHRQGVDSGGK